MNGKLKLASAKDRSTKKRYLRMRGRGREPVSGYVVTPGFAPMGGDTVIAMADLGFMKKPSAKRLANFQDAFIALELDIGSEYFVVAFQAGPDGQVQVFVATTGGVQDVIPIPGVEVNQVVTAVAIADGSTVTLGGLYRESGTEQRKVVPFLSDIPYIGGNFKAGVGGTNLSRKADVGARNLVVVVTPHIVTLPERE